MIEAIWDEGFKRSYKKRIKNDPRLKRKFWQKLDLFLADPFAPKLRTHKLSGKLLGSWAFSVDDDCRIVFEFIDESHVFLSDVGGHDDVY
jgi:addiction module RelE/StbE family toxin